MAVQPSEGEHKVCGILTGTGLFPGTGGCERQVRLQDVTGDWGRQTVRDRKSGWLQGRVVMCGPGFREAPGGQAQLHEAHLSFMSGSAGIILLPTSILASSLLVLPFLLKAQLNDRAVAFYLHLSVCLLVWASSALSRMICKLPVVPCLLLWRCTGRTPTP